MYVLLHVSLCIIVCIYRGNVLRALSTSPPDVREVTIAVDVPQLPPVKSFDGFVDNTCLEEVSQLISIRDTHYD
jgi:hypothetical protein